MSFVTYTDALKLMFDCARDRQLSSELVDLQDSVGRVLIRDIYSSEAIPSFDNSSMDGFLVDFRLTEGASPASPVFFDVIDTLAAGDSTKSHFGSVSSTHIAIEIMTGAPLPKSDKTLSVVKIEDVVLRFGSDERVTRIGVTRVLSENENIRLKGADFDLGRLVATRGTVVSPELLMGLATLGVAKIEVFRRPRVFVLSTGKELAHHTVSKLPPGMIRNSTGPYLEHTLRLLGAEVSFLGSICDDPSEFERVVSDCVDQKPDLVLSTGAVSMGKFDFVRSSIEGLGAKIAFHKVGIRPGKPMLVARFLEGPLFCGIPGNPVSTSVGLRFFVEPFLRQLQGLPEERAYKARLVGNVKKPEGFQCFFKGYVSQNRSGLEVRVLEGQASFMVHSLISANAWVSLPVVGDTIQEGTVLEVFPLWPEYSGSWSDFEGRESMGTASLCPLPSSTPNNLTRSRYGCCV